MSRELEIERFEFSRTHWSIKDVDLFRVLLRNLPPRRRLPSAFRLADAEAIQDDLVSVMMPFHPNFAPVFEALATAAKSVNMVCQRASDIWDHEDVMQDIASLIDRSQVVICDCTGRNANVFYEAGIAHALGRNVILITQSKNDIPFDLQHKRHLEYLNNRQGLAALRAGITPRIKALGA